MDFPEELLYSREHLWVRVEGECAVVGISEYAQQLYGSISALELPDVDDEISQDDVIGSFDARNTVAELYVPFGGIVREVNHDVLDSPALINDDPYDGGWLLEIVLTDADELKPLLSADEYALYIENGD